MLPPAHVDREIIYTQGADVSSGVGSVTIAVEQDTGIVVNEQLVLSDGRSVSRLAITPFSDQRKPPTRLYAVIRSPHMFSAQQTPQDESSTRSVASWPSLSVPRIGFTKLKR
jgi:hypothetical protein